MVSPLPEGYHRVTPFLILNKAGDADEHPDVQALSPKTIGGSPVSMHLYVEDVDSSVERAVAAGRNSSVRLRISFTTTALAGSRTRSAIAGSSQPTRKI